MSKTIDKILNQENIITLLQSNKVDRNKIFTHDTRIKYNYVNKV